MTAVIGSGPAGTGTLKCFLHDLETSDVDEWNKHCIETGHTISGTTKCKDCDTGLSFQDYPYQEITAAGTSLELRCPECFNAYHNKHKEGQDKVSIISSESGTTTVNTSDNIKEGK